MEVEGTQGGEEVSRDPSVDLLLGQYALKFRDTVEDLPGDLEVLTTSIKKSKVAYSRPGPPPPINRATKPKPRPTTWAGIARQAAPMPPPPPGLGPQRRGPSPPPPAFPMGPMKTSPHRSVPSFTSEGPTWKQVLVSFGGTPPDLTKFFTESAVRAANGYLRDGRNRFDILFFQETPWNFIRHAPSTTSMEGNEVIGAPKHPEWLQMVRIKEGEVPHVIAYVSTRLSRYRPAMRRDIVDHRDILVLSLFSGGEVLNLMNIYSDDQHTAIEYLAARVHSLPPFIYMAGDFNCVSTTWDDYEHGESSTAISLWDTASQIGLEWA
ncbi:unnamed protein product [Cyclocybe aegerita]|uniref:Endonuclease/exonuclease/phosphatase domain-containing protein n=1 Tax=Cyclocybe aegerita TaxID=1973307 RepID=A0A8S0WDL9_CYCAE|nr:unnamed protein product [Cyclocybe aegerita]